jgi:hypothetical protein
VPEFVQVRACNDNESQAVDGADAAGNGAIAADAAANTGGHEEGLECLSRLSQLIARASTRAITCTYTIICTITCTDRTSASCHNRSILGRVYTIYSSSTGRDAVARCDNTEQQRECRECV